MFEGEYRHKEREKKKYGSCFYYNVNKFKDSVIVLVLYENMHHCCCSIMGINFRLFWGG